MPKLPALCTIAALLIIPALLAQTLLSAPDQADSSTRQSSALPLTVPSTRAEDPYESPVERAESRQTLVVSITIFALAIIVGVELISKVPATLHTPLMSGSNAISGITVVGAIIAAGATLGVAPFLGFLAVVLAMINVAGGFLVTHRMLMMFKRR